MGLATIIYALDCVVEMFVAVVIVVDGSAGVVDTSAVRVEEGMESTGHFECWFFLGVSHVLVEAIGNILDDFDLLLVKIGKVVNVALLV